MDGMASRIVTGPGELRFERRLPGPIERVWAHLVEPERRARWLAGGLLEPWPGGRVALVFDHATLSDLADPAPPDGAGDCGGGVVRGTVRACEPPTRLVFTWGEPGDAPSEVTIALAADAGDVRLVLTHRRIPEALRVGVRAGWAAHLAILEDALAGRLRRAFWATHEAAVRAIDPAPTGSTASPGAGR
jgi:uncharacterized protein YndB with AHSA1/START domain